MNTMENLRESDVLESAIAKIALKNDSLSAWNDFPQTVCDLITALAAREVLEIGGGRSPSFTREQVAQMGLNYTSNDISARELSKAPEWVGKAHFDIQTADKAMVAPHLNRFDFAFSTMVMEHVESYRRAYENIRAILRPGGVAIAFHPVLYASPFVINLMIPDKASQTVLKAVFPSRTDDGIPKFPAHYSGCFVSSGIQQKILDMGFSDVWQLPF